MRQRIENKYGPSITEGWPKIVPKAMYNNILTLLKPLVMNSIDGTPSAKQDYWKEYKIAHNIIEY